ncbi:MAG: MarR family transcriptional regulator [Spirochaetia bacterium]|jgi:DNA-binding MarR family transcriptional regulator
MESDIQLIELLFQINRRIWKLLSPIFRKEQLSITELLVLTIMSKKKTSRVIQLATVIGVPPSTVTGILDRLVREGFLQRGRDPSDRRSVSITATPKLGSFIRKTAAPIEKMLRAGLGPMAEPRKKRLTADLRFLLESLEQEGDAGSTAHEFTQSAPRGR